MILKSFAYRRQGAVSSGSLLLLFLVLVSCNRFLSDSGSGEIPVIPPPTPPLSRPFIGYGVISVSYTHVVAEPNQAGFSLGYLRKGSVVEVLERIQVTHGGIVESWVFVSGTYQGWLREDVIQVYDNPAQAQTASASMTK
jgi:hypothetical protein